MAEMPVRLLDLPSPEPICDEGIHIHRALAPDKHRVVDWVENNMGLSAASECDIAFCRIPLSCFIATRDTQILGFACYEVIARDFFGPTCVLPSEQGKGIGRALLIRSLAAMRDEGYIYAIIGGVGPQEFYMKTVGAIPSRTRILDSTAISLVVDAHTGILYQRVFLR